jgi:hypothetical protein
MGFMGSLTAALAKPRGLAAMGLLYGLMASQGGRGTLAYFTSTAVGSNNVFTAGTVDITSTAMSSGTGTALTFDTGGVGTADCALAGTDVVGTLIENQPMVPGAYCSGKITVTNASTVDSWLRLRIVRTARGTATPSNSLNDKMKIYMRELTGTGKATDTCKASIVVTNAVGTTTVTVTTATNHGLANGDRVNISGSTGMTGLDGTHTIASVTPTTFDVTPSAAASGTYNANSAKITAQWTASSVGAFGPTNAASVVTGRDQITRGAGLNLDGTTLGTGGLLIDQVGTSATEAGMVTSGGGNITAANLIGNDTVSGNTAATGATDATVLATGTGTRYFCVALHLPSSATTDLTVAGNTTNDNTVVGGSNTYAFVFTAAQKAGRP